MGFPSPGKRGHCTVAKLARSIVAGSVREVCIQRAAEVEVNHPPPSLQNTTPDNLIFKSLEISSILVALKKQHSDRSSLSMIDNMNIKCLMIPTPSP